MEHGLPAQSVNDKAPGRPHRWMITQVEKSTGQNPAYRPTRHLYEEDSPALFTRGRMRKLTCKRALHPFDFDRREL